MRTDELKTTGVPWFRARIVKDTVDSAGRHHREYDGEEIYHLASGGSMEIHAWGKAYRQALEDEGRADLFAAVLSFISGLAWLRTQADRELYAAKCIDSGAYLSPQWAERGFVFKEGYSES